MNSTTPKIQEVRRGTRNSAVGLTDDAHEKIFDVAKKRYRPEFGSEKSEALTGMMSNGQCSGGRWQGYLVGSGVGRGGRYESNPDTMNIVAEIRGRIEKRLQALSKNDTSATLKNSEKMALD